VQYTASFVSLLPAHFQPSDEMCVDEMCVVGVDWFEEAVAAVDDDLPELLPLSDSEDEGGDLTRREKRWWWQNPYRVPGWLNSTIPAAQIISPPTEVISRTSKPLLLVIFVRMEMVQLSSVFTTCFIPPRLAIPWYPLGDWMKPVSP